MDAHISSQEFGVRTCTFCKKQKSDDQFIRVPPSRGHLTKKCRQCTDAIASAKSRGEKMCIRCMTSKPFAAFDRCTQKRGIGLVYACKDCRRAQEKSIRLSQTEQYRKSRERTRWLRRMHGLSRDQWNAMYAAQSGLCAICSTPFSDEFAKRARVDHCHNTGKIRGLLCHHCNAAIGLMFDDIARLREAANYLERSRYAVA